MRGRSGHQAEVMEAVRQHFRPEILIDLEVQLPAFYQMLRG